MRIQVIGGGSWGLAIARHLALNGHGVRLWSREEDNPAELRATRESKAFLPGVLMPETVDVNPVVDADADIAVFAVPSHVMRAAVTQHRVSLATVRVSVAKGIENDSLLRMSEVIEQAAPGGPVVALSGPSHAEEVAHGLPATLVAAGHNPVACERVQEVFVADTLRVYTCPDIIGVELGGSLKNVVAIAAGVCDGLGLGDNAKAALITRGLAEIARLGVACGADPITFAGLSGMGDLIVTCASSHSRNRRLGEGIAQGKTLDELTGNTPMVAEGVRTAKSAWALATKLEVDMPITQAVYWVLFKGGDPREAIAQLMQRDAKPERD
jgi:glycerol-3-phosphate dehydrogenase (NAD(P)+)